MNVLGALSTPCFVIGASDICVVQKTLLTARTKCCAFCNFLWCLVPSLPATEILAIPTTAHGRAFFCSLTVICTTIQHSSDRSTTRRPTTRTFTHIFCAVSVPRNARRDTPHNCSGSACSTSTPASASRRLAATASWPRGSGLPPTDVDWSLQEVSWGVFCWTHGGGRRESTQW